MIINTLILGDYQTNSYVLVAEPAVKDCLVIDTGLQSARLIEFLKDNELTPQGVILTHGHIDHIAGIGLLRKDYPEIITCIHKLDAKMFEDTNANLSAAAAMPFTATAAETILEHGDIVNHAGIEFTVFHTPGHTQGGICLYSKKEQCVFVGDSLFADSVGRTDLPGGNMTQLISSIKQNLLTLPGETKVYPGHGPNTTIAKEKLYNQYLQ